MKKTVYKRFDGIRELKDGNVHEREYRETLVTYTWPKKEEFVHRYLGKFYKDLERMLVPPGVNEPSFGGVGPRREWNVVVENSLLRWYIT